MLVAPGFVSRLRRWFTAPVEPVVACRCPWRVGGVHLSPVSARPDDGWLSVCVCGRRQVRRSFADAIRWADTHDRTHR